MITFATLHEAKRNGTLAQTLAAMTPAERVEAAQVCAANTSRSVSAWLNTFGELMRLADLVPDPDAWVAVSAAPCEPCLHEGTEWVGTVNGRRSCLICDGLAPEIIPEPCPGLQFPCGKPATEVVRSFTGSDLETRRGVELRYCPECAAELNCDIARAA